ncbi:MBL fold metallo-hydrolase [Ruficoccus amylovorans]|uniref:MBL fold metallo-hydrolase n=1 Tax=Ruficoccus amylovorans TaxID=1804625 RepID=A0A842HD81_9BACT|nr:MBL fold metallo-hydrolase [Ruficoccus amylovorans]MBC2594190.1 MBL fold metallo-hydrolase [Ruficoccus amylovorans]
MAEIRLTLLTENTAKGRKILGEHGLAYWIETPAGNVLFDTGQGQTLFHNAALCGADLAQTAAVVLSHGHFDHTGGLEQVLDAAPAASVYFHPDAILPRYSAAPAGGTRTVAVPFMHNGGVLKKAATVRYTRQPTPILGGLVATGEVPRHYADEDTGGDFFLDADGHRRDPINDDQSLYFESTEGLVLILGCAHAGVVNTLHHVARLTGTQRIHAVIGGMHLLYADPARLERTYAAFRDYDVRLIAPCHCTGIRAVAGFWNHFPERCAEAHAGKRFTFRLP